jgi:hypothetical protein
MFTVHTFVLCFVFTMKLFSTKFSHFQTQSLVPLLLNRCHTMALMPTGHLAYNAAFFSPYFTPHQPTLSYYLPPVHSVQSNRLFLNVCVGLGILKYGFACVIEILAGVVQYFVFMYFCFLLVKFRVPQASILFYNHKEFGAFLCSM